MLTSRTCHTQETVSPFPTSEITFIVSLSKCRQSCPFLLEQTCCNHRTVDRKQRFMCKRAALYWWPSGASGCRGDTFRHNLTWGVEITQRGGGWGNGDSDSVCQNMQYTAVNPAAWTKYNFRSLRRTVYIHTYILAASTARSLQRLCYGLHGRGIHVWLPVRVTDFSLMQQVKAVYGLWTSLAVNRPGR